MISVRKAVVPAAGLGTRFLPVTRVVPKVMLPILDIPALHLVVAEAIAAGIENIAVVVSPGDKITGLYFRPNPQLKETLRIAGRTEVADAMGDIEGMAIVETLIQEQPKGLGHAVSLAAEWVGEEPFAVLLPDDLIWSDGSTIGDMISLHSELDSSVVAVKRVPEEAIPSLGIVDVAPFGDRLHQVKAMVEKPILSEAPSNIGIIGRYVLTHTIFETLEKITPGALGELQITDALTTLITEQRVFAYEFPGVHFDVGVPAGMLEAAIFAGLRRPDMNERVKKFLVSLAATE